MKIHKLSILFILQRAKVNHHGRCPLRCRITYYNERHEFSIGLFVLADKWYTKLQIAKPPDQENSFINNQLSLIKSKIHQAFLYLQLKSDDFDVVDIYLTYKGEAPKTERGVIEAYRKYLARIEKLIGRNIEKVTYNKYVESLGHLSDFIRFHFKANDIKLKDLKGNFLEDYDFYLKTEGGKNKQGLSQSTINKAIQRFRRVVKFAMSESYLGSDPFVGHEARKVRKRIIFLTTDELSRLEQHNFKTERVQNIKNLFVFCCYTGLPFKEMSRLKKSDIFIGFDGNEWISVSRSKTDREYNVPLLPQAKEIIKIFNDENSGVVFPRISNQKFNEYLKEVADILGIAKNLTHHVARKTFASTVLLYNNVPMEIVSELLGHAKITTTQESYGKVVQNKVADAMHKLANNII